jgi:hypothetical protein
MKAFGLVFVLLVAKLLSAFGRDLPFSVWLPPALLWQDIVVGLTFAAVVRYIGWRPTVRVAFWVLVVWAAINVPVARTVSSPLTVPMLRAAGGPLRDSIVLYATPPHLALASIVVAAATLLPRVSMRPRSEAAVLATLLTIAAPGPFVDDASDLRGAGRNAVTALLATALPRVSADSTGDAGRSAGWRTSPFGSKPATEHASLEGRARGRNVVMIVLESTGAQYLRTYGAADDPMPTLTALAQDAVQFDAAYAVYPESIKGLFTVLCSRHPAMDVDVYAHGQAPCTSVVRLLREAGYQSALLHSGRFDYLGMREVLRGHPFDRLEDAGVIGGELESSFGVDEPSTVARALSWIDRRDRSRPFFLAYLPIAGHHPYATPAPGPFTGERQLSAYKNALLYGDASMALLLDGLRTRGLFDQTLFVVFGDHGEAFGQHPRNFGHTFFAFDENVRVPLLLSIPGVTMAPLRSTRVASVVDIGPTILSLLGLRVPPEFEGLSLLRGPDRMAFFFTDYALGWVGLRDGCWKYLLEVEAGRSRLFDVCVDPRETNDLSRHVRGRVEAYETHARTWASATRGAYE